MITCNCCSPQKLFSAPKSLYRHQRKYDANFVSPSRCPAKDAYEANPTICKQCEAKVSYKSWVASNRSGKFCSRSCAAKYNNHARYGDNIKPNATIKPKPIKTVKSCLRCNQAYTSRNQKFCSSACSASYRSDTWDKPMTARRRKKQLLQELGHQCQCCKLTTWNGIPITIELDHINGDSEDHSRENTTLLCPNCHSQTPTYRSKNKGNGRAERRKRYAEGKSY